MKTTKTMQMYNALIIKQDYTTQHVDEYLRRLKRDKSIITYKAYKYNISQYMEWFKTAEPRPEREMLREYRAHLQSRYDNTKTINLHITSLRGLYKYLYEEGIINNDPTTAVKNIPTSNERTKSALTEDEIELLMHYLSEHKSTYKEQRNRALTLLLLSNGLRTNEASNINIEDFKEMDGQKCLYLKRKGYQDKSNFVILNPRTALMLKLFIGDRTNGPLFVGRGNQRLHTQSISRIIREIFIEIGIKKDSLSAHSLRHSYAQMLLKAGGNIVNISQSLNHKSLSTTTTYMASLSRMDNPVENLIHLNF